MGFYSESQLAPLTPRTPTPGEPIYLNRPRAVKAYRNKLADVYPSLAAQGADQSLLNPLIDMDVRSVERGQMPMSGPQTLQAIAAATPTPDAPYGRAISPVPERGIMPWDIPANAVSDLRSIFTSIPKLPATLWNQIQDLPNAPTKLAEATSDPAKLAEVPGVNLIPGVYTLSNILGGQPAELLRHPLFTALDVSPYAKARVFDAPASMLDEAGNLSRQPSLYKTVFPSSRVTMREVNSEIGRNYAGQTNKVSLADLAANTRAGQAARDVAGKIRVGAAGTRAGVELESALGRNARNLITQRNQISTLIRDMVENPNALMFSDPAHSRVFGNVFAPDKPALGAMQRLFEEYGDDFGKANYGSIDAWKARRQELGRTIQHDPSAIADLPAHEQAFIAGYTDVANQIIEPYTSTSINRPAPFGRVEFTTPAGATINEVLPFEQAKNIWATRSRIAAQEEMSFLHRIINDDEFRSTVTEQQILDRAATSEVIGSDMASAALQSKALAGYSHALASKGINARPFLKSVMQARYGKIPTPVITELTGITERLPPGLNPPMIWDQLDEALRPRTPTSATKSGFRRSNIAPELVEIRGIMESRTPDYTLLKKRLNGVFDRLRDGKIDPAVLPDSFTNLDRDTVMASIDMMRDRVKWAKDGEVSNMASKTYQTQLRRLLTRFEQKSAPARFYPKISDIVDERMAGVADDLTARFMADDPEAGAKLAEAVKGGNIGLLDPLIEQADDVGASSAEALYTGFAREARDGWKELVDEGFDPRFVHHVPAGKGGKVHFASVNLSARKPGSWHARTLNLVPSETDLALALKSDAVDLLLKKGEDHMIDLIVKGSPEEGWLPIARTKTELLTALEPIIDAEMRRTPGVPRPAVAERVLLRTHAKFDAQTYRNLPAAEGQPLYTTGAKSTPGRLTGVAATSDLYIPKSLHRVIEQIQAPPTARMIFDPVMQVFRTSTLILSPRWQVYNLLGNGLTGVASTGWDFLKEIPRSIDILKRARAYEATPELSLGVRGSLGEVMKDQMEYATLAGEGLSKGLSRLPESTAETLTKWGRPVGRGLSKTQDFLVRMNAMVDDATRISLYLAAEKKALRSIDVDVMRGAETVANRAGGKAPNPLDMRRVEGENLMRDWAYQWDSLTPWERSTARFVFPFYGFFSHILRYSGRYAIDHPFRTAVMASFARNELRDWGTGLPERIHDMLLVGGRDEDGNQLAINFGGWNPFADTANLFTPTGWMSQINPLFTTLAEQFGIDSRTGEAGVYPATAYDPVTGRLAIAPPNAAQSLINNLIPQTQALGMLMGGERDLRATNPAAAGRQMLTSLGIPILARKLNVTQEVAGAEMARSNAARQALSSALTTGSSNPVRAYPTLRAQVDNLRAMQAQNPQEFAEMTQGLSPVGYLDLAQSALIPGA